MSAVTNNIRKTVRSLAETKYRRRLGLFVAEGTKCVLDTAGAFETEMLLATPKWLESNKVRGIEAARIYEASQADMERMTAFTAAPQVIAVYRIPAPVEIPALTEDLILALDRVQDPGNLGTIIRVCDWMGVHDILASTDTADVWNPKVIQATMGSVSRVRVHYCDLPAILISAATAGTPVYGTFLDGDDIYGTELTPGGIIVMGNEGNGIGASCARTITRRLLIPPYPAQASTAESLNVSIATAITLAEFRRRVR